MRARKHLDKRARARCRGLSLVAAAVVTKRFVRVVLSLNLLRALLRYLERNA